jgi:hypothetical protein
VLQWAQEGGCVFITGRKAKASIGKDVTAVQGYATNLDDLDRLYNTVAQQRAFFTCWSPTPPSSRPRHKPQRMPES